MITNRNHHKDRLDGGYDACTACLPAYNNIIHGKVAQQSEKATSPRLASLHSGAHDDSLKDLLEYFRHVGSGTRAGLEVQEAPRRGELAPLFLRHHSSFVHLWAGQ